jgi:NADH-quinone oxidoreductase subunit C
MATAHELARQLTERFPQKLSAPAEFRGEVNLCLSEASSIAAVLQAARDDFSFEMLLDITSIDHMGDEPRFEIVYHLYSLTHGQYLRIKTKIGEENSEIQTVSHLWKGADWHEREIFDMMGIKFKNHPDLRRILMWEGYPYFPLRKEFPLAVLLENMSMTL